MNKIASFEQLRSALLDVKKKVSDIAARAATTFDDRFAINYGLSFTGSESEKEVVFTFPNFNLSFDVTADESIQNVVDNLNEDLANWGYAAVYSETSGINISKKSTGAPIAFTVRDPAADTELTYTPPERFGPVFSFNGRSGKVVPKAGDYTPEMIGLFISTDEEVAEMFADVFGTAE